MSVVNLQEARLQRDKTLILIADAVDVNFAEDDPALYGPLTIEDLIETVDGILSEDDETRFTVYCARVGAVALGAGGGLVDFDAYIVPGNHARAVNWAREFLGNVERNFGIELRGRA